MVDREVERRSAPVRYDETGEDELRERLGVPRVALFARVPSTLDVAHDLGALGAPSGTLVVADEQTAGRGRGGRAWVSAPGAGLWLTLLERDLDAAAATCLALRLGLSAAAVLDRHATGPVALKWPNDLYVGFGKLGGILVEARWGDGRIDWVAIGLGLNVLPPPGVARAATLRTGVRRSDVLTQLVPALRAAARARGPLTPTELDDFAGRDIARGRRCVQPVPGTVRGITAAGALVVQVDGRDVVASGGSLVLEDA